MMASSRDPNTKTRCTERAMKHDSFGFGALLAVAVSFAMAGGAAHGQTARAEAAAPVVVQPGAAASIVQPLPPSRWTVQQIRQAFDLADSDSNGVLTRAEAAHLSIMPRSFEEMDQNKDGILSRAEYEGAFAQ
jgi:hypothetical protein